MDAIILAGQSNMAGGVIPDELPQDCSVWPQNVQIVGPQGAYDALAFEKAGPEVSFAQRYAASKPEPLMLIKYALGGSNLANQWSADGQPRAQADLDKENTCWALLLQAIDQAKQVGGALNFRGFVWMQGERDSVHLCMAELYHQHLSELLQRVRTVTATAKLPAVIGRVTPRQMLEDGSRHRHAHREIVRNAQVSVAESDPYATWVDCDDLPQKPDNLHFITAGGLALGRRFADALLEL